MKNLPTEKETHEEASLFERPTGILLDEKKWYYLKELYHMTPRELQVAILVCRGFNNEEIATSLKIRHGTVKTHLRNIYRRIRVKSKITLLLKFVEDINKYYTPEESEKPPIPIEQMPAQADITSQAKQKKDVGV